MTELVAGHLDRLRLGAGDVVAVLMSDRIDLIATMIGLFKQGCVFGPLDPSGPFERTRAIISNARPVALLTDEKLRREFAASWKPSGIPLPVVDIWAPPEHAPRRAPGDSAPLLSPGRPTLHAPAYIYYTSGSTGAPNGVVGSVSALSRFMGWEVEAFSIAEGWRFSQLSLPTGRPHGVDPST